MPKMEDIATIAQFAVKAEHKARLTEIAQANHRSVPGELRVLIERHIEDYGKRSA